ncbi:hypothetical protein J4G33_02055 [Actinotalea sp. BY-33]|uniref:DUF308 domain-containing protein n=1 Tax=Actinotalea soli TaxID=2819234 RepID=A0A939RUY0_9CELL|nr:hypothetical protein [Actinotalea soli]MBO1750581.1 hypothetical protein [Actinotalea soli]
MASRPHSADEPADDAHDHLDDDLSVDPADAPDPTDVQTRWEEIVAQLGDLDLDVDATEDPTRPAEATAPGDDPEPPRGRRAEPPARAGDGDTPPAERDAPVPAPTGPRAWSLDPAVEEAEEHFTPPEPGPVLGGDPLLTMAWVAAVGVPALVLLGIVLWRDMPTVLLQVAAAVFAVGLGILVWRMPHERGDDDRGNGAVV